MRQSPAIPERPHGAPAPVRARQGDAARAGRPITVEPIGLRRRARLPRPTRRLLPARSRPRPPRRRAALHVAVSAVSLGGESGPGRADEARAARQPRQRDATPIARRSRSRRRSRRCSRRSADARAVTFAYRGERARSSRGGLVEARALVRRRPRPRPRRPAGVPRRPHRRRGRGRRADAFGRPPTSTPPPTSRADPLTSARTNARSPSCSSMRTRPTMVVEQLGEEARRRAARRRRASSSSSSVVEPATRSGRSCSVCSSTPRCSTPRSCAPSLVAWLEAMPWPGDVSPGRSPASTSGACSRSCRGSSQHPDTTHAELAARFEVIERDSSNATSSCS